MIRTTHETGMVTTAMGGQVSIVVAATTSMAVTSSQIDMTIALVAQLQVAATVATIHQETTTLVVSRDLRLVMLATAAVDHSIPADKTTGRITHLVLDSHHAKTETGHHSNGSGDPMIAHEILVITPMTAGAPRNHG
jgi:hypothetical protein